MFEKNLKFALLTDYYGELLDEHTRAVMRAYYDDDLSLSEIAEGLGISRQGVRHVVKKGEEQLEFYEEKLGLAKLYCELDETADRIRELLSSPDFTFESLKTELNGIMKIISDK